VTKDEYLRKEMGISKEAWDWALMGQVIYERVARRRQKKAERRERRLGVENLQMWKECNNK